MKTLITTIALALTAAAPVYAQSAAEIFALTNDSAAERILGETSVGDVDGARITFAQNESPAEMTLNFDRDGNVTRTNSAQAFFALGNDSAAERIVN